MIPHIDVGKTHFSAMRRLKLLLNEGKITLSGNRKLKIYGTLQCKSGKRSKIENRVFFASENEALAMGFRPCGHCLRLTYNKQKNEPGNY